MGAAILIQGGRVADGTGRELFDADVLVDDRRIASVEVHGRVPATAAETVVDARGLIVAPGFIDVHSHADNAPLLAQDDTTKILQGVTTEVVGNCGFSLAPGGAGDMTQLSTLCSRIFPPMAWTWSTIGDLLGMCDEAGYVTNYAPLVGHNALRLAACGFDNRPPSDAEVDVMVSHLTDALDAGVFGLSSGLIYPPGLFAAPAELRTLVGHLPPGAVYATHMRNEGSRLGQSIDEALEVARHRPLRLQISHLKSSGRQNWGQAAAAITTLRIARGEGVQVSQDMYPYTAGSTMLSACLPPWVQVGGDGAVLARLADGATAARICAELSAGPSAEWENTVAGTGYDGILLASTASGAYEGYTVAQIAAERGIDPAVALVEVLLTERLRVSMVVFSMCEEDLLEVYRDPFTMAASDGLPPGNGGRPHPRLFGTFPRFLRRYVREERLLTWPEAIRRITGLPASVFGLAGRGVVRPGAVADLVVFNPETISDTGDYRVPDRSPSGITHVFQAGHVVVNAGWCGIRRGQRLTPQ